MTLPPICLKWANWAEFLPSQSVSVLTRRGTILTTKRPRRTKLWPGTDSLRSFKTVPKLVAYAITSCKSSILAWSSPSLKTRGQIHSARTGVEVASHRKKTTLLPSSKKLATRVSLEWALEAIDFQPCRLAGTKRWWTRRWWRRKLCKISN